MVEHQQSLQTSFEPKASSSLCLGIESSCDETALAFVQDGAVVGHVLASQRDLHALFGGVVPELASREHYRFIGALFDDLCRQSGFTPDDIGTVAVSRGPGLLGSLLVGVAFAKALALGIGARFVGVNHLHAHLLSCGLEHTISFPALGLLVSGGHTNIYYCTSPLHFEQLGRTLDDACGEAYDKVATLLGIQYPGGHILDKAAALGTPTDRLPLPYLDNDTLDFSFSGLKTAVANLISKAYPTIPWKRPVTDPTTLPTDVLNLCASFNHAIAETLSRKLERAFKRYPDVHTCLLAGGVAANSSVRTAIQALADRYHATFLVPSKELCTDNGAMIAYAGWLLAQCGAYHALDMETIPRGRQIPCDYLFS